MKLKCDNGIVSLQEGKLELFTPQKYIDQKICNIKGLEVSTLGLLPYKYYDKVTDTKPSHIGVFNEPTIVTFFPVDISQNETVSIWDGVYSYSNTHEYTKLTFEAGYRLYDSYFIKSLNNVSIYTDILFGGKLDNNIPYQYLAPAFFRNTTINGVDLSIPCTVVQLIIQELCRSITNKSKRFAEVIGKDPKVSPVAYTFANIREICASNSVFSALSFEDMNAMLDASLNMTADDKVQQISPLEKILYM